MSNHTTFKIGGNAAVVVLPKSENEIASVIKECNRLGIRYMTVGNGSNLLVSDDGIDACVILLGKDFSDVTLIGDDTIFAQAGASLTKVCRTALENSLTGLEFAYGIPGSCGGGAFMNAGAYGGELKDVLVKCDHIDQNGEKDLMGRRKSKQPLEFASAGSTFKRPEGYFAGALIEECNLKGTTIGGAQVSTKHAGFVINTGGATCNDVLALCKQVSDTVYKEKGVRLEMEVRVTK